MEVKILFLAHMGEYEQGKEVAFEQQFQKTTSWATLFHQQQEEEEDINRILTPPD